MAGTIHNCVTIQNFQSKVKCCIMAGTIHNHVTIQNFLSELKCYYTMAGTIHNALPFNTSRKVWLIPEGWDTGFYTQKHGTYLKIFPAFF